MDGPLLKISAARRACICLLRRRIVTASLHGQCMHAYAVMCAFIRLSICIHSVIDVLQYLHQDVFTPSNDASAAETELHVHSEKYRFLSVPHRTEWFHKQVY